MTYEIWDIETANLLESFDDEEEAREALLSMGEEHPESADEVAMITYDDKGSPVGPAITAEDVLAQRAHHYPLGD